MRKCGSGLLTKIGNGGAEVWVSYRADRDYDESGEFWDIDWDNVKVFLGETDITDTLCDETWKQLDIDIHEDLK